MHNLDYLKNKKIAILGLGVNNEKLLEFLLKNNIAITICDIDKNKKIKSPHYSLSKLVSWKLGDDYLDNLSDYDIVFRSPGIPYLNKKIQKAKKAGVDISSQTKLFFRLCPAKIIGVTGTKGKGTTSTLIYNILAKSKKKVYLAGNIGEDPFAYLERLKSTDVVVLELSSFQLQDLDKSPHIGVVLNITIDHLDHHKDRKEYLNAKKSIVKFQTKKDFAVINADYQDSKFFGKLSKSKNIYFSSKSKVRDGCYYKNGKVYVVDNFREYEICSRKNIKLLGEHNLENVTASVATSMLAGATISGIRQVLRNFKGLEHRLEYAGMVNKVKYYNDSFSTTPDTTIAAINSFDEPTILIAGGSDKGADFDLLAQEIIDNKLKALILIGEMANKILSSLLKSRKGTNIKKINYNDIVKINNEISKDDYVLPVIFGCENMQKIIKTASAISHNGDVVLLSPACASFGMFKNYKDRGEKFRKEILKLKYKK